MNNKEDKGEVLSMAGDYLHHGDEGTFNKQTDGLFNKTEGCFNSTADGSFHSTANGSFDNIVDSFFYYCDKYSDRPAFSCLGHTITYKETLDMAQAFACYIQEETDLKPGDRIAIQLPNLLQFPVVFFGSLMAGLIVVNTNPLYTARELDYQFKDAGIKGLVVHKNFLDTIDGLDCLPSLGTVITTQVADLHRPVKRMLINGVIRYLKKQEPAHAIKQAIPLRKVLKKHMGKTPHVPVIKPSDVALIQYTGGTTGISKGAMLTHANILANIFQASDVLKDAQGWYQAVISPLPLYHIYAFAMAQIVMSQGGHNILIPNPRDIKAFVQQLKNIQPTAFLGINTLFVSLSQNAAFRQLNFDGLVLAISGGMALTKAAAEQWSEITGSQIVEGYGLTEASPVVALNKPGQTRIGYIGQPVPGTEIKLINADGQAVGLDTPGELCVKGPQVMKGYWNREEETRAVFTEDGYLMTGDIAIQETSGSLKIVDRAKDLIIVSGFNVYPNEVEEVVSAHPDVIECAAIGVPDAVTGEKVKVFVVLKAGTELAPEALSAWCKERLTSYKVPKLCEYVDDLPKSNVGKILRRQLS